MIFQRGGERLGGAGHIVVIEAVTLDRLQHRDVVSRGGVEVFALPIGAVVTETPVVVKGAEVRHVDLGQFAAIEGVLESVLDHGGDQALQHE